jgi:hypothetical protein
MIGRAIGAALLAGALACSTAPRAGEGGGTGGGGEGGPTVATKSIDQVLAAHTDSLMALPGVVGTAIGLYQGERCIKVLLADAGGDTKDRIPSRLEGYRVVIEVIGTIRPK